MGGTAVVGRRVIVTGLAGAGKSTLSLALGARTGLPVIHLDLHYWRPGWVAPTEAAWRETQRAVLAGDAWIADGNYHETLDLRLERADTVVLLDLPWWLCSARAMRRGFRMPGELPPGSEYTRWQRLRDEWRLAARIARKDRGQTALERKVIAGHGQHVTVHELTSKRAVQQFLAEHDAGVAGDARTSAERRPGRRGSMGPMDGLAQVNLIVTELERAKAFWELLGWSSTPRHEHAAVITFPNGMNLVLHEPEFARLWDPAYAGPAAGSTVVDLNLPSRAAVDEAHARVVAAGFASSVEPWDTFFGARYAIVCDADGHRIGLKSPQDPARSYPLEG